MKSVIWKYPLGQEDNTLTMLPGAEVLTVQVQRETIVLWAKGEPNTLRETRRFVIRPTGQEYEARNEKYIATVQLADGELVYHVFEILL